MKKLIFLILACLCCSIFTVHVNTADAAVTNPTARVVAYGDGAAKSFTFNFPTQSAAWIEVYIGGARITTNYFIELNNNQDATPGGSVTFVTAPGVGIEVRLERTASLTQPLVIPTYSPFRAKEIEHNFDRLVMYDQQINRKLDDYTALYAQIIATQVGPAGPVGPEGPQGVQGVQGVQGIQGIVGNVGPSGDGAAVIRTSTDLTVNSTTPVDTGLTWTVAAGDYLAMDCILVVSPPVPALGAAQFNVTGYFVEEGVTGVMTLMTPNSSGTVVSYEVGEGGVSLNTSQPSLSYVVMRLSGNVINNSAVPVNQKVQVRNAVSSSTLYLKAGSTCTLLHPG